MRRHRSAATRLVGLIALLVLVPLVGVAEVNSPRAEAAPVTPVTPPARTTIAGHPVWAHFANPQANDGRDKTILDEVVRLIDNAPAGSTIRGTIYSLSVQPVAKALVAAERRGVTVLALSDGKNQALTGKALSIAAELSNYRFCGYLPAEYESPTKAGGGCISTSDSGDLHVKMFTFSSTTDPKGVRRSNVVWFGSANMTYASGSDQSNNAITVYGDAALVTGLNKYFTDLWNRRHYTGNDYYNAKSGRGYYQASTATVYASPEGRGQTDTVVARLNDVKPNANCQVRIGMNFVTAGRPALLKLVKSLRAKKCRVWMVIGSSGGKIEMDRGVYNALIKAGVSIRRAPAVHDKYFLVYGKFGKRYEYRVYTGSQNWSTSALTTNDEIFVKMTPELAASHPLYDGFRAHFNETWRYGRTCVKGGHPCR
ncbi:phospholipase D-like domain-containing protein [Microlunatus phosphovorus]|nr:phospholipase D-like domain-containing protein [Microlunatus phosphovorus]